MERDLYRGERKAEERLPLISLKLDLVDLLEDALYVNDGHVQHKRRLKADRLTVGGKTKYLKNRNQTGITLSERYVAGSFFMEKGMQDAKPRLERLIESFMEQTAREIEGGRL